MTLTEVSDKFIGYAHQGYAQHKVRIEDDEGNLRTISDITLHEDKEGNTVIKISYER